MEFQWQESSEPLDSEMEFIIAEEEKNANARIHEADYLQWDPETDTYRVKFFS